MLNEFCLDNTLKLEASIFVSKDSIIQEISDAKNSKHTCAVFRVESGEVKVITLRRHMSGGTTSWRIIDLNLLIDSLCRALVEKTDFPGSVNNHLRIDQGVPKIFEVDGRFSPTVVSRELICFKDLIWLLGHLTGFTSLHAFELHGEVVCRSTVGNTGN